MNRHRVDLDPVRSTVMPQVTAAHVHVHTGRTGAGQSLVLMNVGDPGQDHMAGMAVDQDLVHILDIGALGHVHGHVHIAAVVALMIGIHVATLVQRMVTTTVVVEVNLMTDEGSMIIT